MAKKYIKKYQNPADPLTTDRNNVRTKPLGSYKKAKLAALKASEATGSDDAFSYTRADYRADKLANKQARSSEQQARWGLGQGIGSDKAMGAMNAISGATDLANTFIDRDSTKNPTGFDTQQKIGDALIKSGNPYAVAAGVAYKAISGIAEATGGNINTINKSQASEVGLSKGERALNNILGTVMPGVGWTTTETLNGQKSHFIDEMSNAYGDAVNDINRSQTLGGSKFLFGKSKIEDSIVDANRKNKLLTDINMTNTMRKKSDYGRDLAQQNLNRYAGTNYMDMRMGRNGLKFPELDEIREFLANRVSGDIQKFADGGSILPTGKLHKELHHMDQMGEQYEDLTRKGIPVVTLDENNEMIQVAEIEKEEWTLSKEFTDIIEALWKDGSEEAMIKCGRLICEELLRHTVDLMNVLEINE